MLAERMEYANAFVDRRRVVSSDREERMLIGPCSQQDICRAETQAERGFDESTRLGCLRLTSEDGPG